MLVRRAELGELQPSFSLDAHVCLQCGLIEIPDQLPSDFFQYHLRMPAPQETVRQKKALVTLLHKLAGDGLVVTLSNDGTTRGEGTPDRWLNVPGIAFSSGAASRLRASHGPAGAIVARDVLERIDDLHSFMEAVVRLLDDDGIFLVETAWSFEALRRNAFDSISAEHLSLFSLRSIVKLCAYFNLVVADVRRLPIHGGSIRTFIRRAGTAQVAPAVQAMLDQEIAAGILEAPTYDAFAMRVNEIRDKVLSLLWDLKAQGLRVAGYGAPENGNTLLNFCGIGRFELDFLADPDPHKNETFSPGMKIPIRPLAAIQTERPDVLLVLDPNLKPPDGMDGPHNGTRLLLPLPNPRLMS